MKKKLKFTKRKFLLRIFALPFVIGLNLVFLIYIFILQTYRFVMFGGEFITMNKVTDHATVSDILNKLVDMNENGSLPAQK